MRKKKTSIKQDFCLDGAPIIPIKSKSRIKENHPEKIFKDHEKIAVALFECLIANDTESFMEILSSYLRVNKRRLAKKADLARSTIQQALSGKGNPTIKTIAKIIHDAMAI